MPIVEGISWQWIFWVNVPVGLVLLPLAATKLTESRGPDKQLDLPGLGLVAVGLFGLTFGIVRGQAMGWTSPTILASLGIGFAVLAAFVRWEMRAPAPMLPMTLLPIAGLQRHQRALVRDVLRDVRLDLPAQPVLPDRAGLRPARGRA